MKKCNQCHEEFPDRFKYCPVDRTPFDATLPVSNNPEFNLTIINEAHLVHRLLSEAQFVGNQLRQVWPSFKAHPITFIAEQLAQLKTFLVRAAARPHVITGSSAALLLVFTIVLSVLVLEKHSQRINTAFASDDISLVKMIDLTSETTPRSEKGIGADGKGRVGFDKGRGEGSRPEPARSRGGGGGGTHNQVVASQGRPPIPSPIPAPISTTYARLPPAALPEAGLDIDPALWRKLSYPVYGDPRSKSTVPSNGPGEGGGIGTGNGSGIGEGDGPGFGPGRKGNIGGGENGPGGGNRGGAPNGDNPNYEIDRVYSAPDVTQRARVLSKPEPQYTEEARRAQITGTVILRVVFSRSGQVTNIRAMQSLGGGLTEKAMAAARQIRFTPATRNGQQVSMYMQLEYNFNLY